MRRQRTRSVTVNVACLLAVMCFLPQASAWGQDDLASVIERSEKSVVRIEV